MVIGRGRSSFLLLLINIPLTFASLRFAPPCSALFYFALLCSTLLYFAHLAWRSCDVEYIITRLYHSFTRIGMYREPTMFFTLSRVKGVAHPSFHSARSRRIPRSSTSSRA